MLANAQTLAPCAVSELDGAPPTVPISARVTPEYRARIDDLRPLYRGPDGGNAKRSVVLRAFFEVAIPAVADLALHRRLQAISRRTGRDVGDVCREALRAGLDAMEAAR
jgi:hypothetical protein